MSDYRNISIRNKRATYDFEILDTYWYFVWGIPAILLAQIALAAWLLYR